MGERRKVTRYREALREQDVPGEADRSTAEKESEGEAAKLGREIYDEERKGRPRPLTSDTEVPHKPDSPRDREKRGPVK